MRLLKRSIGWCVFVFASVISRLVSAHFFLFPSQSSRAANVQPFPVPIALNGDVRKEAEKEKKTKAPARKNKGSTEPDSNEPDLDLDRLSAHDNIMDIIKCLTGVGEYRCPNSQSAVRVLKSCPIIRQTYQTDFIQISPSPLCWRTYRPDEESPRCSRKKSRAGCIACKYAGSVRRETIGSRREKNRSCGEETSGRHRHRQSRSERPEEGCRAVAWSLDRITIAWSCNA